MKNNLRMSLAAEYMRNYGDEFFKALVTWYGQLREAYANNESERMMETLHIIGRDKFHQFTGIKNITVKLGKRDPSVVIPQVNKNHPLMYPWVRIFASNKEGYLRIDPKSKQAYGTVDFITGKVGGIFCDIPITINMPLNKVKDKNIEPECLAAATLHEVGHIFAYYAFLGRLFTTNEVLYAMHQKFNGPNSANQRLTIIATAIEDINPKAVLKAEDIEKFPDDVVYTSVLSEAINETVSELGHNVYDHTAWEAMADAYAEKNGAVHWLPKMLDTVYSQTVNISGRPLPVFLLFELLKIVYTAIFPPLGILLVVLDCHAISYDRPEARINRIRNVLLESIELDSTLDREDIESLKQSVKACDKIKEGYVDRRQFMECVMWLVSKENRRTRRYELIQRDLEDLANHSLKLSIAEFKTYAEGN